MKALVYTAPEMSALRDVPELRPVDGDMAGRRVTANPLVTCGSCPAWRSRLGHGEPAR